MMARWSVYVVRCRDGALYTGIATDVRRRVAEHARKRGKGAKSLRGRGPLHLVFQRTIGSRGLALRVEGAIKKLPKARKEELIVRETLVDRMVEVARGGPGPLHPDPRGPRRRPGVLAGQRAPRRKLQIEAGVLFGPRNAAYIAAMEPRDVAGEGEP